MKINLAVTYNDGTTKELTATASDLVAFETEFDLSIARLEKEIRWTHICFIAWHIEKRTGNTKDEFTKWLEDVASAEFGETKK